MSNRVASWRVVLVVPTLLLTTTAIAELSELEEILVTARKIEERIQEIPISVQVLSGRYLDEADLSNLFDLQYNVPGLVVNNLGGYGAGFSLRGISDQGGSSQSVASHMNGIYLGTSHLAIARIFDMDRIEVLKGPQGTLYGRNSTGGSINFITRAPEGIFSSEIEAAVGSFETARVQGFVNLPSDKADFRVAFIGSGGDGYIRNSVDDRRFAEDDHLGLRASLRVELSNSLGLDVMAQHMTEDGASGELWLPNPQFLPDQADLYLTTVTLSDPYLKTQQDVVSIDAEYDLGFATLRSLTGFARSEVDDKDDCAGLPLLQGCIRKIGPDKHRQWSQEFQFASSGDGKIDWLTGIYLFDADTSTYYYFVAPVVSPIPQNDEFSTSHERAAATYTQASVNIVEPWTLTAGLRYSREESRISNIGTGRDDNLTLAVADYNQDHLSWRVDLAYAASEEMLVYAGISTGFKSGGVIPELLPNGEFDGYKPEELLAYEAGIKSQWLGRRLTLNAAAFFYDFREMQVRTVVINDAAIYPETDNAARAKIYGIDAAGTFDATDRLTLSGGMTWLPKRDFVDYRNDETGDTLSGNKLSRVPEWTAAASVGYTYPFRQHGNLTARVEYNYRSAYFFTKENMTMFWQDSFGLLNTFLQYEPDNENWYLFASGRNLTDEAYFTQVFIQSSPGYPTTWEMGFGLRF